MQIESTELPLRETDHRRKPEMNETPQTVQGGGLEQAKRGDRQRSFPVEFVESVNAQHALACVLRSIS